MNKPKKSNLYKQAGKHKVQLRWGNHWRVKPRRSKGKHDHYHWYYIDIFPGYATCTCSPEKQFSDNLCIHINAVKRTMLRMAKNPDWKPERDHP